MSDFEAVWVTHVTGSNACRWYLGHIWVCLVRIEGVLAFIGPVNGHFAPPERRKIGLVLLLSDFERF